MLATAPTEKQKRTTTTISPEERNLDIDGYFEQQDFDGDQHIDKEANLTQFFVQKYERISNQMKKIDDETELAATKARSSVRNYGVKLKVERDLFRKF